MKATKSKAIQAATAEALKRLQPDLAEETPGERMRAREVLKAQPLLTAGRGAASQLGARPLDRALAEAIGEIIAKRFLELMHKKEVPTGVGLFTMGADAVKELIDVE